MADDPKLLLEAAFEEADKKVRQRLRNKLENEPYYLMLALLPDGGAVIRSNCNVIALREMAKQCAEIADQVEAERPGKPH